MIQTTKNTSYASMRKAAILPLIVFATGLFAFTPANKGQKDAASPSAVNADKKIVLLLDAGHGGKDNGASGNGLLEKDLSLKIVNRLKTMAADYNIEAKMTRTDDTYPGLEERVKMSNKLHPDYFISIHINSTAANETVNDKDEFWFDVDINPNVATSKVLANHILDNITLIRDLPLIKHIVTSRSIHVLRNNKSTAILLSIGNIKSKMQMDRLNNEKELDQICSAILQGVVNSAKG